jgi:PadR family transcriptional regulator, regulatory protein AphA
MARSIKSYFPILGILRMKSMSGYEIRSWIEEYLGYFWNEGWGQLYPALKYLEERGFIRQDEDMTAARTKGKREKKVYSITESGRAYFVRYLREPPEEQGLRDELLLKVFFGAAAEDKVIRRHLEVELAKRKVEESCQERLDRDLDASVAEGCSTEAEIRYWKFALLYGRMRNKFLIDWCEAVLRKMDEEGSSDGD